MLVGDFPGATDGFGLIEMTDGHSQESPLWSGARFAMNASLGRSALLIIFLGVLLVGGSVWLYLSLSGFCFGQARYLNQDEYIDAAIAEIIRYERHQLVLNESGTVRFQSVKIDQYKSVSDFKRSNPNCCKLVPHNAGLEVPFVSLFHQLFGFAAESVSLTYALNYFDESGRSKSIKTTAQVTVGNCGAVLNTGR